MPRITKKKIQSTKMIYIKIFQYKKAILLYHIGKINLNL